MIGEKIIIRGGRVIDPANGVDASVSVCIADGKIEAVGDVPKGFAANQEIDAQGQIVCPGFVDLCVRLREPGQEHKATVASETAAAAAAGVTILCCPPTLAASSTRRHWSTCLGNGQMGQARLESSRLEH